ncbi:MAG: LacI family DNA-binding transcriptional regulator [bacterium]
MGTTMNDVAKEAGVSVATVSKYINGGNVLDRNEKAIQAAIDLLDYEINQIARGLKTNSTKTVGVLIPSFKNIFFTTIISDIEEKLRQEGYSIIVCDYREDSDLEKEKLKFLLNKRVDGIIMVPTSNDIDHIKNIYEKKIPIVLIDRMIDGLECDVVAVDNINASYNSVEELIKNGHQRIGIICGPKDIYTTNDRLKGYYRVMEDYNIDIKKEMIQFSDYKIEGGYDSFNKLMNLNNPPTAIFVTNYEMTLGSVIAINENNINIPTDLSIIGFDNIQLAKIVNPSLSIVVQPMNEIGDKVAEIILKRLKGDCSDFPEIYRLKTELLIKESVSCLN